MSDKFKVGDRVREKLLPDSKGKVISVREENIKLLWDGSTQPGDFWCPAYKFELIPEAPSYQSPVNERVVKEIMAGVYGIVSVPPNAGKVSLIPKARDYTSQDLRHAARVFNDIAEALEGKD